MYIELGDSLWHDLILFTDLYINGAGALALASAPNFVLLCNQ